MALVGGEGREELWKREETVLGSALAPGLLNVIRSATPPTFKTLPVALPIEYAKSLLFAVAARGVLVAEAVAAVRLLSPRPPHHCHRRYRRPRASIRSSSSNLRRPRRLTTAGLESNFWLQRDGSTLLKGGIIFGVLIHLVRAGIMVYIDMYRCSEASPVFYAHILYLSILLIFPSPSLPLLSVSPPIPSHPRLVVCDLDPIEA